VGYSSMTPGVFFPESFDRPPTAAFDVPNASFEGGAVLLCAPEQRLA
jgi:hypothetical protein